MPEMLVTLVKGDKIDPNTDYRDALPVNMQAIPRPILEAQGYMLCQPGLTQLTTGYGKDRGGVFNDRVELQFRVSGQNLISIDSAGTVTALGGVPGSSQASMPFSFNTQAVIVDGNMFLYDATNGFRQVTDADLGNPIDGEWVDGYYFLTDGDFLFVTDLTDESSIDPLKFATSEFAPDKTLGIGKTQDNKVIVFNRYSTEYFVNQALDNFPFQRVETRAQKIGIVATHAKCEVSGNWYITGGRKEESLGVHLVSIGQSVKVSTREIDKILAQYTEPQLADMRMESRKVDDLQEVIVHLPDYVLCFNVDTANKFGKEVAWSIMRTGTDDDPWRGINGVFDSNMGEWVYGDKTDNKIGLLDNTVFTQYGVKQEWILYTPFINMEAASIDEIEIETIPGSNTVDDATVAFSITIDGRTYSQEHWALYGLKNVYTTRYIQRRIGDIDDWVGFKFRSVTTSRMSFGALSVMYG